MTQCELWKVNIALDTNDTTTRAWVRIRGADDRSYLGIGLVRAELQRSGSTALAAELAIARALSDVTEELLEAVSADIDAGTGTRVRDTA